MNVEKVEEIIRENKVVIFSKTYCVYCQQVKDLFDSINETCLTVELDTIPDGQEYQEVLLKKTNQSTVPNVFINQVHIGGCDAIMQAYENNTLHDMLMGTYCNRDYDLIVIGGGSGGLSAAREAAKYGKRVAVCDFVNPTPLGTSWGLGGTCVNVGCIPKKIMHQASLTGAEVKDAHYYGWNSTESPKHTWESMIVEIQNYIKSLNFNYKKQLREASITYLNECAVFASPYEIQTTDKKGNEKVISAHKFIIAVGGRPRYPDIPGAKEYGISSDDLFSLAHSPGKTLIVGASYVGLECAGILAGFGLDVTVMVRSILLRGFDQQMANMIGEHMESIGVKFLRNTVPLSVEKTSDEPKILSVSAKTGEEVSTHEFNTVLFAIGRDPCTKQLGLTSINVDVNENNGKIMVNDEDQTSVSNIYAIGDVIDGKPELTPVAIKAGRLLAMRLFAKCQINMNYDLVPTTVFTPLEYGCVGYSEEAAVEKYGCENIEVYHSYFQPLEYTLQRRENFNCYAKLICLKPEEDLVIGLHVLGPNAGEMTQGFALAIKLKAKLIDFHNLIGIHPTCAESFTTLYITKSSGLCVTKTIC